ncbi:MAG: hypothetical protein AB7D06_00610 [Pedobacter sp.]
MDHSDIIAEEVLCEEMVVACVIELPMDQEFALSILVYRSGCSCRRKLEDWLKHMGRTPARVVEISDLDAILGMRSFLSLVRETLAAKS